MRITLHWRGEPLLALDLTAQSPDDAPLPPPGIEATAGGDFERAEPTQPDTSAFGFGGAS